MTTRNGRAIFITAVITIFGVSIVNVAVFRGYIERGAELGTDIASQTFVAVKSTFNDKTEHGTKLGVDDISTSQASAAVKSTFNDTADNLGTASCPEGQFYMQDRVYTNLSDHPERLIPNVLYQTSKNRCLVNIFKSGIDSWRNAIPGLSNVFHDDEAMDGLLSDSKWDNYFPNLKYFLKCVNHAKMPVMKADVWRYLIVWENGGVYADLDLKLDSQFRNNTIHEDDDSFFTIDATTGTLSQYFFAASPRHPILYIAIHAAIDRVLSRPGTQPPKHTGPGALKVGHIEFLNSTIGAYHLNKTTMQTSPIDGRRVHIEPERRLLVRDYVQTKRKFYHQMGMSHYNEDLKRSWKYPDRASCWQFAGLPSYP